MNKINLVVLALILTSSLQATGITIHISGMVCAFCSQGLKKKFAPVAGIEKVTVNLDKQLVKLDVKEGQDVSDETIKALVTQSGFAVESIDRGEQ